MDLPCYFINLERSPERLAHMRMQAERIGVTFNHVPAIDCLSLSERELRKWNPDPSVFQHHQLDPSVIACFLSHRKTWELILDTEAPYGAVFEDDILFSDDAGRFLADASWIDNGIDLIKLETTNSQVQTASRQQLAIPSDRRLKKLFSTHLGTSAYIVSRKLAQRLLLSSEQISEPVDWMVFGVERHWPGCTKPWQMSPAICIQQMFYESRFLPNGANLSDREERVGELVKSRVSLGTKAKLRGWAKVNRELRRPFSRFIRFFSEKLTKFVYQPKWSSVPFRESASK